MVSCIIDAMKVWDIEIAYIPVAFLQTGYNKRDIHIKMEVTILEEIKPAYYMGFI